MLQELEFSIMIPTGNYKFILLPLNAWICTRYYDKHLCFALMVLSQYFTGTLGVVLLMKLTRVLGGNYEQLSPLINHLCLLIYYPPFLARSRSRSRSYSPQSRRYSHGVHPDDAHRSKDSGPKIEYITEFGSSGNGKEQKLGGYSPPPSPPSQTDALNRSEHLTFNSRQTLLCCCLPPFCYQEQTFCGL